MKKYLAFVLALCLVVTFLSPMFTMAEEFDTSKPSESASADISPSPSDAVSPSPSDAVSPSPSDAVSPSPSDAVSPSPSDAVSPSPSNEVSPSPSGAVSPSPSDEVSPSPEQEVFDVGATYEKFMSIEDSAEAEKFLSTLNAEELSALEEYALSIENQFAEPPKTVSTTSAGPLISPVKSAQTYQPTTKIMRLMSVRTMSLNKDTDGVELSKIATPNADGTYTIRLEAYTTSKVTTQTTGAPADIVLVLDQSGSMSQSFSGSTSRQAALKSAAKTFIGNIRDSGVNHRIAIVTFGTNLGSTVDFSDSYNTLISTVDALPPPSGSTDVAVGMEEASRLLSGPTSIQDRNKVVIVFTDGVPSSGSNFDTAIATRAIEVAHNIKNSGATIYTIGIFGGADSSQLYGSTGFSHNSDGSKNSYWSGARVFFWGDVTKVSVPAGNRFLNYLSSEYGNATEIALQRSGFNIGLVEFEKFTITKDPINPSSYENYYLSAEDTQKLSSAFNSISTQICLPITTLGNNVTVSDYISEYFDMPTTGVRVSTVACTGKSGDAYTWSSTETPFTSANVVINTALKTISISGFAYDEQFVTEISKPGGGYGSKLVICFEVSPRSGFWGGNMVPTNTSASGLYAGNAMVEDFNIPTVDVLINVPFSAKSASVYLGNTLSISDLYNPISATTGADAWKDDFIDVGGITCEAVFTPRPTEDQSPITVTATVRSLCNPSLGAALVSANASIFVYKPQVTFSDSSIYLGEKADFTVSPASVIWKHGETLAVPANMLGVAPALSYTFGPEAGFFKTDTAVDVSVSIDDWNITQYLTFVNNGIGHAGSSAEKEFTVRVVPCSLTVSKSGCSGAFGENQTFILHVTGTNLAGCDYADEVNLTIVLKGNGSKTITGLPVGNYTVTEDGNWSWRYASGAAATALSRNNTEASVCLVNSLVNSLWLSGTNWVQNVFSKKVGVST